MKERPIKSKVFVLIGRPTRGGETRAGLRTRWQDGRAVALMCQGERSATEY